MRTLATYSIKGGVGKTSAAVNLGYLAARDGHRTLLWDLDPQGAATYLFRVRPKVKGGGKALVRGDRPLTEAIKATDFDSLDLLPADFTYRNLDLLLDRAKAPTRLLRPLLAPLAAEYDVVVLDCPPGITLLSESVLHAAGLLVVPVIPTPLAVRTLDQLIGFLADLDGRRPDLLAFLSMVDRRKALHREIVGRLSAGRSDVAATAIPALAAVEGMGARRAPLSATAPRGPAGRRYEALWREIDERTRGTTTPPARPGR